MSSSLRPVLTGPIISSSDSAPSSAVVFPFDRSLKRSKGTVSCIFCGQTIKVQTFRGKAVCSCCLKIIPSLFSCS